MEQNVTAVFFVFKASADLFSLQLKSLPEVFFFTLESANQFKVVAMFCSFAKLEGAWKPTEVMTDNLRTDKMNVSMSM